MSITIDELKKANGYHFQNLFTQLMKEKYGNEYQEISTSGPYGDMGIDGILNFNTAFAVYAPEKFTEPKTLEKIESDFNKFLTHRNNSHWSTIDKYIFVIKTERTGITPKIMQYIAEINNNYITTKVMTMDDLEIMMNSFRPFSDDGQLLQELKNDFIEVFDYIIKTDFAAEYFSFDFPDRVQNLVDKWSSLKYIFKDNDLEKIKINILCELTNLQKYFDPIYIREVELRDSEYVFMFRNDSFEAGNRLREDFRPNMHKIRTAIRNLALELLSFK